jgi:hypothetical protein
MFICFFFPRLFYNEESLYPLSPEYLNVVKNDFLSVDSISEANFDKIINKEGKEKRGPFGTLSEQLYQRVSLLYCILLY